MVVAIWAIIVVSIGVMCAVGMTHRMAKTRKFSDDFSDNHVVDVASGRIAWSTISFSGLVLAGAVAIESFPEAIRWLVVVMMVGALAIIVPLASWLVRGFFREDKAVQLNRD